MIAGATTDLDLSIRDREPIRTPGSIQPHGMLLTLAEPGLEVRQASRNAREMLGVEAEDLLSRPVESVLGGDLAALLREAIADSSIGREPYFLGSERVEARGGRWSFDALAHRSGGMVVLELEPSPSGNRSPFRDLYPMVRNFLSRLEGAPGVVEVCALAAAEVRRITGVDRVLIYRFDEGWNGTVIAEARDDVLPSYLGHRFPASDSGSAPRSSGPSPGAATPASRPRPSATGESPPEVVRGVEGDRPPEVGPLVAQRGRGGGQPPRRHRRRRPPARRGAGPARRRTRAEQHEAMSDGTGIEYPGGGAGERRAGRVGRRRDRTVGDIPKWPIFRSCTWKTVRWTPS